MKIRGTPAHIAEKYLALSRDAQSSGDPVLAENYLQHAEHYSRIIMAYRDQLGQSGELANGNGMRRPGEHGEGGDEFGDEEGDDLLDEGLQPPPMFQPQAQPRQQEARNPGSNDGGGRQDRQDRPFRRDQGRFRDRGERNDRDRGDRDRSGGDRDRGDRERQGEARQPFQERERLPERQTERASEPVESGAGGPRRRDRFQQPHEQPDFLRRPVRRSRSESDEAAPPPKDEPPRD